MNLLLLSLALCGSALASQRAGDGQWSKKREAANSPSAYGSSNSNAESSSNTNYKKRQDNVCQICKESGGPYLFPNCDHVCPDRKREAANSPSAYGSSNSNAESSSSTNYKKRERDLCKECMESGDGTYIPYCVPVCRDRKREAANSPSAYGSSNSNAESSSNTNYKKRQDNVCQICKESGGPYLFPNCDHVCPDRKREADITPPFFPETFPSFPSYPNNGNSNSATSNNDIRIKRETANSPSAYGSSNSNAESSSNTNYKKRQDNVCQICKESGGPYLFPNCDHVCPDRKREAAMPPGFPEMPKFPDMPEFPSGNGNSNSAGSHNNVPPGTIVHSDTSATSGKKREAEEVYNRCKCDYKCNIKGCHEECRRCDDSGCRKVSHCNGKRDVEYLERLRRSIQQRR